MKIMKKQTEIKTNTLLSKEELLRDFLSSFYIWHKEQGYAVVKKEDYEDFIEVYCKE